MTSPIQQDILRRLTTLCELSPGIRVGQLIAHLGFLAEDTDIRGLDEIEDEELLRIIDQHRAELSKRKADVA